MIRALACCAVLAACVAPASTTCEDGRRCPSGKVCDEVHGLCVSDDQLATCAALSDGDACPISGGREGACRDGVCLEATCGDGIAQNSEDCDGDDLRSGTEDNRECTSHGYYAGGAVVTCTASCEFETSACVGICGDGVLQSQESCDGGELGAITSCTDLGYYNPGAVSCNALCRYDDTMCTGSCGDGVRDPVEICDGAPPSVGCSAFGYDAGYLDCLPASCAPAFGACHQIGWKAVELSSVFDALSGMSSSAPSSAYATFGLNGLFIYDGIGWRAEPDVPRAWDVYSPAPGIAWTHGDAGMQFLANGVWSYVPAVTPSASRSFMEGTSASDVYTFVAGRAYHFDGQTWVGINAPVQVRGVWAASATDYWVIGQQNGNPHAVYRGSENTWTAMPTPLDDVQSVWGAGSTVFVGGIEASRPAVARYDGTSWTVYDLGAELDVTGGTVGVGGRSGTDAYAFRVGGEILAHFDGTHWLRNARLTGSRLSLVDTVGPDLYVGGSPGVLARESPNAIAEIEDQIPGAVGGSAVWARSCTDVFVAHANLNPAEGTSIHHFDGVTWQTEYTSTTTGAPLDITGGAGGAVYAVTNTGQLLQRQGTTWSVLQQFAASRLSSVWADPSGTIVAVGDVGYIHRFDGSTWTTTSDGSISYEGVWGRSPSDIYAVGNDGGFGIVRHFDGLAWSIVTLPFALGPIMEIWGDANGSLVLVDTDGRAAHRVNGTWTERSSVSGENVRKLVGSSASDLFAVTQAGTAAHFDGTQWAPVRPRFANLVRSMWTDEKCSYVVGGFTGATFSLDRLYRSAPW